MLKTNSKAARENIRAYIMANANTEEYAETACNTFEEVAAAIYADFDRVTNIPINRRMSLQDRFCEYAAGLPSIIDTCYYYNRSAVDDLAEILEETPEERAKYSEDDAERLLSLLIFREIEKAVRS